jgi:hypothetical protein
MTIGTNPIIHKMYTGNSCSISFIIAKPTQPNPPTRKSKDIRICQAISQSKTNLGLHIWKTTFIFQKMEDELNFLKNGRRPQFFKNGRLKLN